MATKSSEFLRLTEIANSTSAEGDSRRYSQNLSRCCTNTVSTNHLRILLLYSRYGCSASNQSFAGPLERQFLLVIEQQFLVPMLMLSMPLSVNGKSA